ncbi:MAG: flavohemoprotein [bacterium]|jgi:hemoglobin-like flavoprotein|nr:flavohemoprotein [bacterium]
MALQVDMLETSFDEIAPRGEELMDIFYQRLFELDPEVQRLFGGTDMAAQKKKLLSTLVLLRNSLRDPTPLVPALKSLGARHAGYGVAPEHYPVVGQALISAMMEIAGRAWQPEYTDAWAYAYQLVQDTMLEGASESLATSESDEKPGFFKRLLG